jgi:hypothetical protein
VYDKKSQKNSIEIELMGKVRLCNPDENKLSHHSELADFANQARDGCLEGMLRVPQAGQTHSMQSFAGIRKCLGMHEHVVGHFLLPTHLDCVPLLVLTGCMIIDQSCCSFSEILW